MAETPTNEQQDARALDPKTREKVAARIWREVFNPADHEMWSQRGTVPPEVADLCRGAAERLHRDGLLAAVSAAAPASPDDPCECGHPWRKHGQNGCGMLLVADRPTAHGVAWCPCAVPPPAAAPDERAIWAIAHQHFLSDGRHADDLRSGFVKGYRAALAARPAPVVSGEDVERAVRALCGIAEPTDTHLREHLFDVNRVIEVLGITVADAPAAEPIGTCDASSATHGVPCLLERGHGALHRWRHITWDDHHDAPAADDEGAREVHRG